jgi:hypothetical protein
LGFLEVVWLGHAGYTFVWEFAEIRNGILTQMGVRNLFPSLFFSFLRKLSSLFRMKNNNQMNKRRMIGNDK